MLTSLMPKGKVTFTYLLFMEHSVKSLLFCLFLLTVLFGSHSWGTEANINIEPPLSKTLKLHSPEEELEELISIYKIMVKHFKKKPATAESRLNRATKLCIKGLRFLRHNGTQDDIAEIVSISKHPASIDNPIAGYPRDFMGFVYGAVKKIDDRNQQKHFDWMNKFQLYDECGNAVDINWQ